MAKTKGEIVQGILNKFRPELYIKKIKCGFDSHFDGSVILKCEFTIDKKILGDRPPSNEKLTQHSKTLANKIKRETNLPIKHTQTTVKYL